MTAKDLNNLNGRSKMRDITINTEMVISKLLRDLSKAKNLAEVRMIANQIAHRAERCYNDATKLMGL